MADIKSTSTLCGNCHAVYNDCVCEYRRTYTLVSFDCDSCKTEITTGGGRDVDCRKCGACYNGSGQRLRSDWRSNPSVYDDEVGDLEGFELQHAGDN